MDLPAAALETVGVCNGHATEALVRALSARAGQARACYEQLLRSSPHASGRLLVALRVDATGEVSSAEAIEDDVREPALTTCTLERLKRGLLPAPAGGCANINVPLRFEVKPPASDTEGTDAVNAADPSPS
jgi:hypothetical protein